jgi:dienelactone hydrolase
MLKPISNLKFMLGNGKLAATERGQPRPPVQSRIATRGQDCPRSVSCGWALYVLLLTFSAGLSATLFGATETNRSSMPWNLERLYQTPKFYPTAECAVTGLSNFFYEGLEYKARPTKVFAYYAAPPGQPPAGGWPAVVCAHGGGGTAFPEWVKQWNQHGYAAIAMDLEGHLPEGKFPDRRWHENAGPARVMTFMDIELAEHEQWFYHAVADVVRANSLLRSFPEINRVKIGLTGISWGGVIASAVAGIDSRFAFVIPVYGCGFLHQGDGESFRKFFQVMTKNQLETYASTWDPSVYLPRAAMPMLWLAGSNDFAFPMDIWQRSALAAAGPRTLCLRLRMPHGHTAGWKPLESYAFADSVVKGAAALPRMARPVLENGTGRVRVESASRLSRAELYYTTDTGEWSKRVWKSGAATIENGRVEARLPGGAKVFFFNVSDERGLLSSSEFVAVAE